MPGWHKATSQRPEPDRLATVGVVLEQHPDRARLFMQWHEMDWPVMWDPFNLLEFPAVPVTYLLDATGKVLVAQPLMDRAEDIHRRLLDDSEDSGEKPDGSMSHPTAAVTPTPGSDAGPEAWTDHATSLALWGGVDRIDVAVDAARRAADGATDPVLWFRLGVVLRLRNDSVHRRVGDFAEAVAAWTKALNMDPNQYVWRRRLQQYGPRLAKPYPFYDWIPRARDEVEARGERPVVLLVKPQGAEFAQPGDGLEAESVKPGSEPDPDARVHEDEKGLIEVETVLIPPTPRPGDTVRVHLVLTPDNSVDTHWNNEAGHSELWVDPPANWQVDRSHQLLPIGRGEVSHETRHLELEIAVPDSAETTHTLQGYLLYYACEGAAGVCVYRRRNLDIPIPIATSDEDVGLAG